VPFSSGGDPPEAESLHRLGGDLHRALPGPGLLGHGLVDLGLFEDELYAVGDGYLLGHPEDYRPTLRLLQDGDVLGGYGADEDLRAHDIRLLPHLPVEGEEALHHLLVLRQEDDLHLPPFEGPPGEVGAPQDGEALASLLHQEELGVARPPGEEDAEPPLAQGLQDLLVPLHLHLGTLQDELLQGEEVFQLGHGDRVAEDHLHLPHLGGEVPDQPLGGGVGQGEDPISSLDGLQGEGDLLHEADLDRRGASKKVVHHLSAVYQSEHHMATRASCLWVPGT
jgi:hypothetical protein